MDLAKEESDQKYNQQTIGKVKKNKETCKKLVDFFKNILNFENDISRWSSMNLKYWLWLALFSLNYSIWNNWIIKYFFVTFSRLQFDSRV